MIWELMCVFACVFIWFTYCMLHCHGDLKQGKYLVWDVLCFGEARFSSVPVTCCKNTHTAISQNVLQQHTQTHLNPMNPIFLFFPPSTILSSSLCLSGISADLSRLPSVHLLFRPTGSSSNIQTLLTAQLAERSPYTTACHPDPEIQTRRLTEGINYPCLYNWPGRLLSTRPGAGASASASASYCRHRRQCVVGVKMMEWNPTFQKCQSSSACYSSHSQWTIHFQIVFYIFLQIKKGKKSHYIFGKNCTTLQPELS